MHAVLNIYSKKVTEHERKQFISQLGKYGKLKGNKIVLVFDGGPYEWPYREYSYGVYVVYAGVRQTADDYIKEYLDEQRSKDVLLISGDAELCSYASRLDIPAFAPTQFWKIMRDSIQSVGNQKKQNMSDVTVKMTEKEHAELDALMVQASKIVPLKSEDIQSHDSYKDVKKYTASKKERKLLKKLNKL